MGSLVPSRNLTSTGDPLDAAQSVTKASNRAERMRVTFSDTWNSLAVAGLRLQGASLLYTALGKSKDSFKDRAPSIFRQ